MPKKNDPSFQPQLLTRDTPELPDGYYSSGPNPNLRQFVEEIATPYDIETDNYTVPPFNQAITTTKATALYNLHTYWSKKPHDAIRQYIRHYTQPGDLVLDPMCGSGSTALAALMEGRAAIAIDISPAATFIAKNYCTPIDPNKLQSAFHELEKKVKPEMDWLYETRCDRCDGRAMTTYTVYSQVFQCPRCLEKVPLFDCLELEAQTSTGKSKVINACPNCHKKGIVEEIRSQSHKLGAIPVKIVYECLEGCKPKRAERFHNDSDTKKRSYFEQYDLGKLREIDNRDIPYWYPPHRMMNVESDTDPWGDEWRLGRDFRTVAELFTRRNLWGLALVRSKLSEISAPEAISSAAPLWVTVSTVALTGTKMLRETKRAIQAGTYYIPQISREIKIWNGIDYNYSQIAKGLQELSRLSQKTWDICISTQSALDLNNIPSNTVDYIFTDPPYGGKVQYGELNFVWEAWLGLNTRWHDEEIIINEVRGKTDIDWAYMMRQAMTECYRVLKPGRWISLCYHDTSEGTWQSVQDMMTEIGFIPELSDEALYIDTDQKSYNQLIADKVTRRDLVINFRKPHLYEVLPELVLSGDEDEATFAEKGRAILREALQSNPGSPPDRLYDGLVSRMVRRGEFERHNFDALLRSVAEEVDGRWYLLETAGQIDETEREKEEAAASRLEAFMEYKLEERPEETGIHYSELFEQYLLLKDKSRRQLRDWLPEFFYKTPDGTWRPPVNEEERDLKAALRTSGALQRIKRFANALLAGVPPFERDLPSNVATAADWIRHCRRAGLYDVGRALYEKGGFDFAQFSEEARLEVEEDYQICMRRSQ